MSPESSEVIKTRFAVIKRRKPIQRRPPRRKLSRSSWRILRDKCDALLSLVVRLRGKRRTGGLCELCMKNPIQVAFHFIPRGNLATRWELDGSCASCSSCNYSEQINRGRKAQDEGWRVHHVRLVGEARVVELEALARTPYKPDRTMLGEIAAGLAAKLESRS